MGGGKNVNPFTSDGDVAGKTRDCGQYLQGSCAEEAHYEQVAEDYNAAYFYSPENEEYQHFLADGLQASLRCVPEHTVVDLGGGTGHFTAVLRDRVGLDPAKLWCVDPSPAMVKVAAERGGMQCLMASAQDFATRASRWLDRIFLKEVVHHIPHDELHSVFRGLHKQLFEGGILCIVTRMPSSSHYPFFDAAHSVWEKQQDHFDLYVEELKRAGFGDVDVAVRSFEVRMPTESWLDMLRLRFWSTFSHFSDSELEVGVEEVRERLAGQAEVVFPDKLVFVTASKLAGPGAGHDTALEP